MTYTLDTSGAEFVAVTATAATLGAAMDPTQTYEIASTTNTYIRQGTCKLITCVAKASLVDGEILTITDSLPAVVYEFDVNGTGVTTGRTQVNVSGEVAAAEVADRLALAIAATQTGLTVTHNYAAQVIADTVFTAAANDVCTAVAHGMLTGDGPVRVSSDTTLPAGLTAGTDYWVIKLSANTFSLAASLANAYLGTAVDITNTGTGVHTLADVGGTQRSAGTITVIANGRVVSITTSVANVGFTITDAVLPPSAADGSSMLPAGVPRLLDGRSGAQVGVLRVAADGVATLTRILRS